MKTLFSVLCAALAVLLAPPSEAATGGLDGLTAQPGHVCEIVDNGCETIFYNNFVPFTTDGQRALSEYVTAHHGQQMSVVGYSLGGAVITNWLIYDAIPGEDLSFITFGNPFAFNTPNNTYPVTDIIHQYDQLAEAYPWWNPFAVANHLASTEHFGYSLDDLNRPNSAVVVDGSHTTITTLTYPLPLLKGLDPAVAAQWDPVLRPLVEFGYPGPRPQPPTTTTATAPTNAAVASVSDQPVATQTLTAQTAAPTTKKPHRAKPVAAVDRVKPTKADATTSEPVTKKLKGNKHADQSQGSSRARGSRGTPAGGDSPQP